jgi:hypothetical protein
MTATRKQRLTGALDRVGSGMLEWAEVRGETALVGDREASGDATNARDA